MLNIVMARRWQRASEGFPWEYIRKIGLSRQKDLLNSHPCPVTVQRAIAHDAWGI
jgi:hypothetical protein